MADHGQGASRTWTDEELRKVVPECTSWRAVCRALGLRASSSAPLLRQRARQLGLDTSHFTGNRRWVDKDLARIVAGSSTWNELLEELGYAVFSGTARQTIRAHAARLDIDLSHLATVDRGVTPFEGALPVDMERLRDAAPSLAKFWFAMRRWSPSEPSEPRQYDLVVESPQGFKRVQVKSTTAFHAKERSWRVSICRRTENKKRRQPYGPDEVDLFFVIDGALDIYLIPLSVVGGRVLLSLKAYTEFRVGNARGLVEGMAEVSWPDAPRP